MIKILKPGFLETTECKECGALLRYDTREDVKSESWVELDLLYHRKYIICPQCGRKNVVELINGELHFKL